MAAIMDEWVKINAQCRKIGEATGIEVPPILYRMEGDVYARQNQRLTALSSFLGDVAGVVTRLTAAAQTGEPLPESQPKKGRGKKSED